MNPFPPTPGVGDRRFSAWLPAACLALAVALPALTLYGLASMSIEQWLDRLAIKPAAGAAWPGQIAPWQTGVAMLLGMLPVSALAYALLRARLCFVRFGRGEVFSHAAVGHLRGLAAGMLASAGAALVVAPLISVVLSFRAPPGQRSLAVGASSQDLLLLLFAAIVWRIAHAMTQAVELADDHAQIV